METYGVNFEGFEPSCGWAMYKHTEEELIPYLKADIAAVGVEEALKYSSRKVRSATASRPGNAPGTTTDLPGGLW